MASQASKFIKLVNHPLKFRLFLFLRLPSAFFAGVRIKEIDTKHCVVTIPYKWFSQNPFKSTYFACLSMAAEMSTGALGMAHIYKRQSAVSMLVVTVNSSYYKKATDITTFICEEGEQLNETIEKAIETGEGEAYTAKSVGKNKANEIVAEFFITWSFKERRSKN